MGSTQSIEWETEDLFLGRDIQNGGLRKDMATARALRQVIDDNEDASSLQNLKYLYIYVDRLPLESIQHVAHFLEHFEFSKVLDFYLYTNPYASEMEWTEVQLKEWHEKTDALFRAATRNPYLLVKRCSSKIDPSPNVYAAFLKTHLRSLTQLHVKQHHLAVKGQVTFYWHSKQQSFGFSCPFPSFPALLSAISYHSQAVQCLYISFHGSTVEPDELAAAMEAFQGLMEMKLSFLCELGLHLDASDQHTTVSIVPVLQRAISLPMLTKIELSGWTLQGVDQASVSWIELDIEFHDCAFPDGFRPILERLFGGRIRRLTITQGSHSALLGDSILDGIRYLLVGNDWPALDLLDLESCQVEKTFLPKFCSILREASCSLMELKLGRMIHVPVGVPQNEDAFHETIDGPEGSIYSALASDGVLCLLRKLPELGCIRNLSIDYTIKDVVTARLILDAMRENLHLVGLDGIRIHLAGRLAQSGNRLHNRETVFSTGIELDGDYLRALRRIEECENALRGELKYMLQRNRLISPFLSETETGRSMESLSLLMKDMRRKDFSVERQLSVLYDFIRRAKHAILIRPSSDPSS